MKQTEQMEKQLKFEKELKGLSEEDLQKKEFSIEEMKMYSFGLIHSENYVKRQNERAKNKIVYWHETWKNCKRDMDGRVGYYAAHLLGNSYYWDKWHNHLKSLATNLR